jgi:hypothetical protein
VEYFAAFEQTALSDWVRSSPSYVFGFPGILVLHALGMGFLAGGNIVIDLRLLGLASQAPVRTLRSFLPVLWAALAVNAFSGVLLLIGYPTKALTNPLFYFKMLCIAAAVALLDYFRRTVLRSGADSPTGRIKLLAALSLALWITVITAGRLLAYTHTWLTAGHRAHF